MRAGLAALTGRGRAFLAAGITCVVCAMVLDQPALSRIGVLLVALPLLSAFMIARSRYRLALRRTVSPQLVSAGQPAQVDLELANDGHTRTGLLLLEEHLPYTLGTRPRFYLDGIGHGWRRKVTYQVRSDVRGRYQVGPLTVRVGDAFGLVELDRAFHSTVDLTVTPRTVTLPNVPLGSTWAGTGDNRPRAFASGSAEDVTVREYRQGDDLRRVHWRSSARAGELMVRREEQPWQSRATLFLDNRVTAHRGKGPASSLEAAVTIAASVAVHLNQRGFVVRLVTADGEDANGAWHEGTGAQDVSPLLESLAVVAPTKRPHLETGWLGESTHSSVFLAVFGTLNQHDHAALSRMLHHGSRPLAVALDVDAWVDRAAARGETAAWLTGQGWRAVRYRPSDRLPTVWRDLGRRSAQSASRAGVAGPEGSPDLSPQSETSLREVGT